jgi:uncharacterized protein YecE (DUF72 family)
MIHVGTGGWIWIKDLKAYSDLFKAVEINTSFYRIPKREMFARWADSVPDDFMFSVKLYNGFTHRARLAIPNLELLTRFVENMYALGNKLGPLLVQLPPSLPFDESIAAIFFVALRERYDGDVVCEPRHKSWFTSDVNQFLAEHRVALVAADPWIVEEIKEPGGWKDVIYYRLHGSPTSETPYSKKYIRELGSKLLLADKSTRVWCIFDMEAVAARPNALEMVKYLEKQPS